MRGPSAQTQEAQIENWGHPARKEKAQGCDHISEGLGWLGGSPRESTEGDSENFQQRNVNRW